MQKQILLATLCLFTLFSYSQKNKKDVPDFGKIEKADLELKECDFDPKANAEILFDVGELSCVISSSTIEVYLERRVRIKVLGEKGRDVADVKIPYLSYQKQQSIDNLSAQTYNLDASGNIVVTKVDGKLIYDKPVNKRYSEKIFTFPDVKAGSIIEYKYKKRGMGLLTWYFQRSYPVLYSRYRVDFPQELEVFTKPYVTLDLKRVKDDQGTRMVETFSMEKVPALRDEAFILNEEDYMERVESQLVAVGTGMNRTSLIRQWPSVIKDLMEDDDFGVQLKKDIPRTSDLDALLKGVSDPYDKMVIIHNYVKRNMQWNGYDGIWALDGVKAAWKDKKGTSGEINLILTNLLKNAGLEAYPVLVSSHDNGLVKTAEADISQFNKVLAYVKIGEDFFVLDGTQKDVPTHLIPPDVTLNEGLLISKPESNEWGWKTLWNDNCVTTVSMLYTGNIDEKGKMTGDAVISSYDYARLERLPVIRKGPKDYQEKYLSTSNPGISIDSISFENVEIDTLPLNQKIHFTQQLASSGNYKYFNANFFTGLEKNPFIAEKRFSDVFFGVTQNYTIIGTFFIPDGYVVEGLPKNIKMVMPDKSIEVSRTTQSDDISIYVRIDLHFKKPFYDENDYPSFREFYKKLQDLLNEQFVINKK